MTLLEAIAARHSVRKYQDRSIPEDVMELLQDKISQINAEGCLHVQLVTNEPKSFRGINSYGLFSGVQNYFVVAGSKKLSPEANCKIENLDERAGYFGEQIVLLCQQLGLNTCWVGATYKKISGTFTLEKDERVVCYIAVGYGENQGEDRKRKSPEEVSDASDITPSWYHAGVAAALLAPTAVNQQKFCIRFVAGKGLNGKCKISIRPTFSLAGYTKVDLGIVKYHFEVGAGKEHFDWV